MVRFFLLVMILTAAFYAMVTIYSRSVARERLEKRWDEKPEIGIDRDGFVKRGLERYDRSFRRKAAWLIFVVPFVVVAIRIYTQNFSGHR